MLYQANVSLWDYLESYAEEHDLEIIFDKGHTIMAHQDVFNIENMNDSGFVYDTNPENGNSFNKIISFELTGALKGSTDPIIQTDIDPTSAAENATEKEESDNESSLSGFLKGTHKEITSEEPNYRVGSTSVSNNHKHWCTNWWSKFLFS